MTTLTEDRVRAERRIVLDFLYLDLNTCTRCVGTDRNLAVALAAVRRLVEQTGSQVEVRKHLVETVEMARELRLVTSPTIRVNGTDIALELKETSCGTEACTDGCGEDIDCRVWTHRGEEFTEAPIGLIMDAVLREIYAPHARGSTEVEPYQMPENLQRFFQGKASRSRVATATPVLAEEETVAPVGCCSPAEQQSCCEATDKAACCGSSNPGGCGCQ